MNKFVALISAVALAIGLTSPDVSAIENPIDSLQPGEWYEAPNSRLDAVDPCPARDCSYSGVSGIVSVMGSWSSGAYDTKRDRLIVWRI
jgi:hypothetical protein